MKKEIIGYITASINGYERIINRLHTLKASPIEIKKYENFTNEFNDLLDYVTDIPEENQESITVVLNNTEVETLKSRINELEETCVANNEVIDAQFKKINDLKDVNCIWQNACNDLRDKNEGLKEMVERAKRIVTLRDDTIYNLKEKLAKVKEHELPYIDFQKIYDGAKEMGEK